MTAPTRIPTPAQALAAADRTAEILARLRENGVPTPSAMVIGPVRLEFAAPKPAEKGASEWD